MIRAAIDSEDVQRTDSVRNAPGEWPRRIVPRVHALGRMSLFFFNDTATTEIYTLSLHDALPILNVDGMNIISNDGSNKLNRSRKARVSYKVQRTINASLNAATSTRAVSSNPNFVTRQKIEIIFG